MIQNFFKNVTFHASYANPDCSPDKNPVIAFAGRSNSGKSSLVSTLCNHKNLARVSATPGKTRLINYFLVAQKEQNPFYIVDLPGFGYASMSLKARHKLRELIDNYLATCKEIVVIVLVLDARRKPDLEELNILAYCKHVQLPIIFARTKWDKLNVKEKNKAKAQWKKANMDSICIPVSSLTNNGIDNLLLALNKYI